MLGHVLKDLDDGLDDGAEDGGDVNINRLTVNISKILKNLFARNGCVSVRIGV